MALAAAARRAAAEGAPGILCLLRLGRFGLHTTASAFNPAEPKPVPLSKLKDSFNEGTSITYLEELEERYHQDPSSVDRTWQAFFRNLDHGVTGEAMAEAFDAFEKGKLHMSPFSAAAVSNQTVQESMRLLLLIRAYQVRVSCSHRMPRGSQSPSFVTF
jgi:2-oxoglutarate dehydrogenase E1 component